jgi:hypothetical protein
MINTALALAKKGLAVFPCTPRDKTPACPHGCLDATTDVIQIQAWWQESPLFNIGLATGHVDGAALAFFAIDVDGGEAETAIKKLEGLHGALPATVEVITGREDGGRQLWFKLPDGVTVRNSESKLAENVDVRGHHGYVIAPPSIHPTGRCYAWSVDSADRFADAPSWLLELVAAPTNGNRITPAAEWHTLIAGVTEGQRNCGIAKLAGMLLRRHVDPIVTRELLRSWNTTHCLPPLPESDVDYIVNSIAGRELRRRGADG